MISPWKERGCCDHHFRSGDLVKIARSEDASTDSKPGPLPAHAWVTVSIGH